MPPDALPVVDGTELLREHWSLVERVDQRAGVMEEHFRTLYLSVLDSLASLTQRLPMPAPATGTIFETIVTHALDALGRRQGAQLPAWAPSEQRAMEHGIWTYATFTAAILRHTHYLFAMPVQLYSHEQLPLTDWNPATGPMPDRAAWYQVHDPTTAAQKQMPECVGLLLAEHLLPAAGLAWLWAHPDVIRHWMAAIGQRSNDAGELQSIIETALDGRLNEPSILPEVTMGGSAAPVLENSPLAVPEPGKLPDGVAQFIGWACRQLASTGPDQAGLYWLREGLAVTDEAYSTYGGMLNPKCGKQLRRDIRRHLGACAVDLQSDGTASGTRALLIAPDALVDGPKGVAYSETVAVASDTAL